MLLDPGHHNISQQHAYSVMNTNMRNRQQLLLSHLPIMSKPFQERIACHLNERNLTLNQTDASGRPMRTELTTTDRNVHLLDLTNIFQLGLILKLVFFYMVVGMNTRAEYRFAVIAFCVGYYFY